MESKLKPLAIASNNRVSGVTRKADLVEAAVRIFSEKGYDGSSLQDIAERIGILKGSIYYYYKSKEDILFDVIKLVHDEHLNNARSVAFRSCNPLDRLRKLLTDHAAFVCRHLERAAILVREMQKLPHNRVEEILGPDHAYQRVFRDLISEAQELGDVADEANAKLATLWVLGALNSIHRWYRPERVESPEAVAAHFADQLTRSLAASALWRRFDTFAAPLWALPLRREARTNRAKPDRAPRRLPRSERRVEVLQAATRVFFVKGYEAASLQDIADETGITKASLYYYVNSKEELLHAVLAMIMEQGMDNVRSIVGMGGDPLTRLWRLVAGRVSHLCEHIVNAAVFLHERRKIPLERRRRIAGEEHAYQMVFVEAIRDGQAAGLVRADVDASLAALSILGSTNWIYTWYRRGGDLAPNFVGAQFATMTINSLAVASALETWVPEDRPLPIVRSNNPKQTSASRHRKRR